MNKKKVIVLDVVGLCSEHLSLTDKMPCLSSLLDEGRLFSMEPVFPALTLPVQASLTSGVYPETHGVVANGFYFPESYTVAFWEQASSLVQSERIWDRLKRKDPELKTAMLFFQNSLYASCDVIITPKPMHTDDGLIQWCYSKPVDLYEDICKDIGEFNLMHFWGPMASIEGSRWIAGAALEVMARHEPNLMFVYLPHLDYCCQKFGPHDPRVYEELTLVDKEVGRIVDGVKDLGMEEDALFIVLSEYAMTDVQGDIPLNRLLRENGLLRVREIQGREYLDCEMSPAFAMVDHQIAHIYIKEGYEENVRTVLERVDGIDIILDTAGKKIHRIDHPRSGDLIAVSAQNRWFSYYWWEDRSQEPDFATRVDIHRKPGYDPLEMFLEPGTFKISQDTDLIRGSHGYPAVSENNKAVFLVSGNGADRLDIPPDFRVTDVPTYIERYLTESV